MFYQLVTLNVFLPETISTCKLTKKGKEYIGTQSQTKSGKTCQRWDSQFPHAHFARTRDIKNYPDTYWSDVGNNCRNPDNLPGGPWCYTTDANERWEYCDISYCEYGKYSYYNYTS